jgi:hypothetical protein
VRRYEQQIWKRDDLCDEVREQPLGEAGLAHQAQGVYRRSECHRGTTVKALTDKDAIKSLDEPSLGAPLVPVGRLESHGALCASPPAKRCGECSPAFTRSLVPFEDDLIACS